jgi:hypothetical protein
LLVVVAESLVALKALVVVARAKWRKRPHIRFRAATM